VLLLGRGLLKRGINVDLACRPGGELARRAPAEGINVWKLPVRGEWDALAAWRLGTIAHEMDILHAHTSHTHTVALMAVRIGTMRPVVVHRRVDFEPGRGLFTRWKYRAPDRFIAISDAVAQIIKAAGVPESKIRVVYSGIEPKEIEAAPRVDLRHELGLGREAVIVGNIAQLVDHKGHRYLIDAMPELLKAIPEAHLVIVGSGPLENDLRAQIQNVGLAERIHLLGYRNDANGLLKSFDLFVMPSHLEGMGTVVLDAFAASIPVVAASAGGLAEIVMDGVTGHLVPPRDPRAIAQVMIDALTNKAETSRMAENALKSLHENYTADCMVEGVLKVYREFVH